MRDWRRRRDDHDNSYDEDDNDVGDNDVFNDDDFDDSQNDVDGENVDVGDGWYHDHQTVEAIYAVP